MKTGKVEQPLSLKIENISQGTGNTNGGSDVRASPRLHGKRRAYRTLDFLFVGTRLRPPCDEDPRWKMGNLHGYDRRLDSGTVST